MAPLKRFLFFILMTIVDVIVATTYLSEDMLEGNYKQFSSNCDLKDVNVSTSSEPLMNCATMCILTSTCAGFVTRNGECGLLETCLACCTQPTGANDGWSVYCPTVHAFHSCPDGYTSYCTETNVCMKMVTRLMTKAAAKDMCASSNGHIVTLIDDNKHDKAAELAEAIYTATHRGVWVDAMMNVNTKTWFWKDATAVNVSRFNQINSNFINRPIDMPCVKFLSTQYYMTQCDATAYALCEAA